MPRPVTSRWRMRCLLYTAAYLSCRPCSFAVSLAAMSANSCGKELCCRANQDSDGFHDEGGSECLDFAPPSSSSSPPRLDPH
jgi:hypothetical protein